MIIMQNDGHQKCHDGTSPKDHNYQGALWTIAGAAVAGFLSTWTQHRGGFPFGGGCGEHHNPHTYPYGGHFAHVRDGDGCCHSCFVTKDVEERDLRICQLEAEKDASMKAQRLTDKLCETQTVFQQGLSVLQQQIDKLRERNAVLEVELVKDKELADCRYVHSHKYCVAQCVTPLCPTPMTKETQAA